MAIFHRIKRQTGRTLTHRVVMRIGLDATSLPASLAGAGRYIRGLVTGLASVDTGHDYTVFIKASDRPLFGAIDRPNITFVPLPLSSRPGRLFWEIFKASEAIKTCRLDVWHAPHYIVPWTAASCKVAVTFHDMVFHLFPEFYPPAKRALFRWAMPHAVRTAHRLIATSEATRDEVAHILRVDPGRITVIHPGLDEAFRPVKDPRRLAEVRQRYGVVGPYLLAVGTLDRRKNLNTLIRAYHRLIERNGLDAALVIAGQQGNGHADLLRDIRARRLEDRVRLLGYVEESDLPALYSGACLFVSPSRYEGFGFPALEALACGARILSSPSPSILETTAQPGLIVESPDVETWCERILSGMTRPPPYSPPLEDLDRYAWARVAEQTVQVYEEIAGRSSMRSGWKRPAASGPEAGATDACAFAVLKTIVYGDLFEYPLTLREIHRNLIGCRASPARVAAALQTPGLSAMVGASGGYYTLRGRKHLGAERPRRAQRAIRLFDRHRRLLYWLCACPFVRMTALSGAMAFHNCKEKNDIDLFLVVDARRLWTTYAFMAVMARLIGKRDLLCLNYLIGRSDFPIPDHDFFTAHQIANLRPLYGWTHYRRFTAANGWVMGYLPQWNGHADGTHHFPEIRLTRSARWVKRIVEWAGLLPAFTPVEWLAYTLYRRRLERKIAENGGVQLARDRIKLHTNDHSRRIMDRLDRRMAEVMTRDGRMRTTAREAHAIHNSQE